MKWAFPYIQEKEIELYEVDACAKHLGISRLFPDECVSQQSILPRKKETKENDAPEEGELV